MLFTLSVALNEVAPVCQANNFAPLEHKPASLSGALQLCGHRGSLTHSLASPEGTVLHPTLLQSGLVAASVASKGGQARPRSGARADERLKVSSVKGSALVTSQANGCLPPTHQPDPATST